MRYLIVGAVVAALAVGGLRRTRRDPMRELFVEALPGWQIARTRPEGEGAPHSEPARRMEKLAARRLPVLVPLLARRYTLSNPKLALAAAGGLGLLLATLTSAKSRD